MRVDGAEGRYQGLLVMQLPGDARNAAIEGADQLVAAGPDGDNQVVAAYVQLDRDAVVQRTISFVLPARDRDLQDRTVRPHPRRRMVLCGRTVGRQKTTHRHLVTTKRAL